MGISGRRNSKCKIPQLRACLIYSSHNNEVTVLLLLYFLPFFGLCFSKQATQVQIISSILSFVCWDSITSSVFKAFAVSLWVCFIYAPLKIRLVLGLGQRFQSFCSICLGSILCMHILFPMGLIPSHTYNQQSSSPALSSITSSPSALKRSCPFVLWPESWSFSWGFVCPFCRGCCSSTSGVTLETGLEERKKNQNFLLLLMLSVRFLLSSYIFSNSRREGRKKLKQGTCLHMSHFFSFLLVFPMDLLLLSFQIL